VSIDTTNKKLSLISLLKPWDTPIPVPEGGSLSQGDLQHLLWGYSGILWAVHDPLAGQDVFEIILWVCREPTNELFITREYARDALISDSSSTILER